MALTTNLEGYWKLNQVNTGDKAIDSTTNNNNLTNNNSVPFVAGKVGNGADLEFASSQYFSITDAAQTGLDFSDALTFAGWVKYESIDAADSPFIFKREAAGNQRAYDFYSSTTVLGFDSYTDGSTVGCGVSVSWSPSTATWYHVAVTKSGTSIKFYVDGAQQGTTQTGSNGTIYNASSAFEFGAFLAGAAYFDGIMDEWGAWSRELSSTEISELYNSGNGLSYPFSDTVLAFDTAASFAGGASPKTVSYPCTGANRALVVLAYNDTNTTDNVSGITYNGVSMSRQSFSAGSGITGVSLYTLLNPASGTNNLTVTWSGGGLGRILAASFVGVDQTNGINAQNTNGAAATTTVTNSITTSVAGIWGASLIVNASGTAAASTNINAVRVSSANYSIGDSDGSLGAAGTYSLTWTQSSDYNLGSGAVGLREVSASGPTNVKTWDGVTQSTGIKTYMGVTLANTKTVDGIS